MVLDRAWQVGEREASEQITAGDLTTDVDVGTFRPGLRVKRVQGTSGVFEMTWAPDGRATWQYGDPIRPGIRHIIWRRVGTDAIFDPGSSMPSIR